MKCEIVQSWSGPEAVEKFLNCCGSKRWALHMAKSRPFLSFGEMEAKSSEAFDLMTENDWLEAFAAHPKIGDRVGMEKNASASHVWAAGEQSAMVGAASDLLAELMMANRRYDQQNGFIFIVCATGKSPREMLTLLQQRLLNDRATEIKIAAEEQKKITRLRLEKLLV